MKLIRDISEDRYNDTIVILPHAFPPLLSRTQSKYEHGVLRKQSKWVSKARSTFTVIGESSHQTYVRGRRANNWYTFDLAEAISSLKPIPKRMSPNLRKTVKHPHKANRQHSVNNPASFLKTHRLGLEPGRLPPGFSECNPLRISESKPELFFSRNF